MKKSNEKNLLFKEISLKETETINGGTTLLPLTKRPRLGGIRAVVSPITTISTLEISE